ncbi:Uncharacterised protein [Mycobacteroides abscessus]|nr:Uncharacterised protein [Mycobacteroides abscessus]
MDGTAQCRSRPSRSCQISVVTPSADAYEMITVPITTAAATGLRNMTSTMRKTNASATAANSKKSSLTYPRNSAVPVPNPVRLTELPARVPSLVASLTASMICGERCAPSAPNTLPSPNTSTRVERPSGPK